MLANLRQDIPSLVADINRVLTTVKEHLARWKNHFEQSTEQTDEEDIGLELEMTSRCNPNRNMSTNSQTECVIRSGLKVIKRLTLTTCHWELLKHCSDKLTLILCTLMRDVWNSSNVSTSWKEGLIVTLPN